MISFALQLAPLSVNEAFQGRRYKTPKYDAWIEEGLWLLKGIKRQERPYKIGIEFYMAQLMDIDNPIKMLLDLLKKAGIIDDDRYVMELVVLKKISKEKKIIITFN